MIILLLGFFTFTTIKNQKMKSKITLIALAAVLIYSCTAKKEVTEYKSIPPTEQKAEVLTVVESKAEVLSPVAENPETIKLASTYDGRNLYGNNCGNCHELYAPADYSKEKWVPIMQRMQKKARTTDAETLAIYNYLITQTK